MSEYSISYAAGRAGSALQSAKEQLLKLRDDPVSVSDMYEGLSSAISNIVCNFIEAWEMRRAISDAKFLRDIRRHKRWLRDLRISMKETQIIEK